MCTSKLTFSVFCVVLCSSVCMAGSPLWTWVGGPNGGAAGVYGTKGVADGNNMPGFRNDSISWTDGSGNFWLFGGVSGMLRNDLWKFDGANWTWVSGSSTTNQLGIYGTKGTPSADNVPGARFASVSSIDRAGNLWLFGGEGYGADMGCCGQGTLNDLWVFDGENWTWVSGSNVVFGMAVYGEKGIASADNVPGCRYEAISWSDANGNFWLFGGRGDTDSAVGYLNDLWKFDGAMWTWVSGSKLVNQASVYGTKGVPDGSNVPSGRYGSVSWVDNNGNLWLFGGEDSPAGQESFHNDLWRFDGQNWTWVSGSNLTNQSGVYGTKGVADACNVPGARREGATWVDGSGNLWLFGGLGYTGTAGYLNDLWKFDGANWTWVSGSNTPGQFGVYGTKGVASADNIPGARHQSISWSDASGALWVFGGYGLKADMVSRMNDLWKFGIPDAAADMTGDGTINVMDLMAFAEQWESSSATSADLAPQPAGDGVANFRDFAVLAAKWPM